MIRPENRKWRWKTRRRREGEKEEEESDRSVDSCVITLVLLAGGVPSRLRVSY